MEARLSRELYECTKKPSNTHHHAHGEPHVSFESSAKGLLPGQFRLHSRSGRRGIIRHHRHRCRSSPFTTVGLEGRRFPVGTSISCCWRSYRSFCIRRLRRRDLVRRDRLDQKIASAAAIAAAAGTAAAAAVDGGGIASRGDRGGGNRSTDDAGGDQGAKEGIREEKQGRQRADVETVAFAVDVAAVAPPTLPPGRTVEKTVETDMDRLGYQPAGMWGQGRGERWGNGGRCVEPQRMPCRKTFRTARM